MRTYLRVAATLGALFLVVHFWNAMRIHADGKVQTISMSIDSTYQKANWIQSKTAIQGKALFSLKPDANEPDFYLTFNSLTFTHPTEVLFTGGNLFTRNDNYTKWHQLSISSDSTAFQSIVGLTFRAVINSWDMNFSNDLELQGWKKVGSEIKEGRALIRYAKDLKDFVKLINSIPSGDSLASKTAIVDLWVNQSDNLPDFARLSLTTMADETVVVDISIDSYNDPVTIPSPDLSK